MSKVLIKISTDWADEFQAEGFAYCDAMLWKALIKQAKTYFKHEVYFGTNECLDFRNYDEYKKIFKVIKLTDEQYDMLCKLFPEAEIKYERRPEITGRRRRCPASIMLITRAFGIFPLIVPDMIDVQYHGLPTPMYPDWVRSDEKDEEEIYFRLLGEFFDGEELPSK